MYQHQDEVDPKMATHTASEDDNGSTTAKKRPSLLLDYAKSKASVDPNGDSSNGNHAARRSSDFCLSSPEQRKASSSRRRSLRCDFQSQSSKVLSFRSPTAVDGSNSPSQEPLDLSGLDSIFDCSSVGQGGPSSNAQTNNASLAAISFRVRRRQGGTSGKSSKDMGSSFENLRNSLRDLMDAEEDDDNEEESSAQGEGEAVPQQQKQQQKQQLQRSLSTPMTGDRRAMFAQTKRTSTAEDCQSQQGSSRWSRRKISLSARDVLSLLEDSGTAGCCPRSGLRRQGSSRRSLTSCTDSVTEDDTESTGAASKAGSTRTLECGTAPITISRRSLAARGRSRSTSVLGAAIAVAAGATDESSIGSFRKSKLSKRHGSMNNLLVPHTVSSSAPTDQQSRPNISRRSLLVSSNHSHNSSRSVLSLLSNGEDDDDDEASTAKRRRARRRKSGSMRNVLAAMKKEEAQEEGESARPSLLGGRRSHSCKDLFAQAAGGDDEASELKPSRQGRRSALLRANSSSRRNLMASNVCDGEDSLTTSDMSHLFVTGSRIRRITVGNGCRAA